jgi:hypothetical protein
MATADPSGGVVSLGESSAGIDAADSGSVELSEMLEQERIEIHERKQITLQEALDKYELVEVINDSLGEGGSQFIIMAERSPGIDTGMAVAEFGYSSPSPWTAWTREEWNPKLRDKLGLREYYKMKRTDGIVRGALRMLKTPLQAGRWFIEPASDSTVDKNIAEFVSNNLFEGLNVSWSRVLDDILLMCEYGHMVMEKVFEFDSQGRIKLRKLAPRHPMDIQEWVYDVNGGPNGVIMEPLINNDEWGITPPEPIFIPIRKLAVFALEAEAGDLNGTSVLRSAYKHYFFKDTLYKIDAIQKERHGIGVPVIKLPPGYSDADKKSAENLGRNLRTNDRAHVVLPPNWDLIFAKLEGQPVDCLSSIEHHNQMIQANVLTPFLTDSNVDPKSTDMFMKSTRYIGATIYDVFNLHIIPQLVNFNFRLGVNRSYPKLMVRRVGEWEDIRTMSFAFRNFVGSGAIVPDDPLEKFIRRELDLPQPDPTTARIVATPQGGPDSGDGSPTPPGPPDVGPPRQKATATTNSGRANTGNDKSGG